MEDQRTCLASGSRRGGGTGLFGALFYAFYWGRRALGQKLQQLLVDPDAFWSRSAKPDVVTAYSHAIDQSIPVLSIANYKGGVGKSMISANLAAYFDKVGFRVLLVDYDYQGSLTDIVPYPNRDEITFSAQHLLEHGGNTEKVPPPQLLGGSFERTRIHPAEANLSKVDSTLICKWLLGEKRTDIRFNTHAYLNSPYVRANFDLVIIDTPPRISAATANALCASTHVLMPTILDTVSSRAVFRSVEMFLQFRDNLNLVFEIIGVIPSKVDNQHQRNNRESQAQEYLKDELHHKYKSRVNAARHRVQPIRVLEELPIMHKVDLLHMEGDDLAMFDENPTSAELVIQEMFAALGNHVLQRTGLCETATTEVTTDENSRIESGVIELEQRSRAMAG